MKKPHHFVGELFVGTRHFEPDDFHLALHVGEIQIEMQTAALQRVGQFPAVVACEDDQRYVLRLEGSQLRHAHLEIAQHFQQKSFELRIRLVDLVDQEHGRLRR